jgi:hypothetical protein
MLVTVARGMSTNITIHLSQLSAPSRSFIRNVRIKSSALSSTTNAATVVGPMRVGERIARVRQWKTYSEYLFEKLKRRRQFGHKVSHEINIKMYPNVIALL